MRVVADEAPEVASFYALRDKSLTGRACAGTACFVAQARNPERFRNACSAEVKLLCLGKCYAAPATAETSERPKLGILAAQSVVLERILQGGARSLSQYVALGGYRSLAKALAKTPDAIIREVEISHLRGRGGAGFATARKLHAVAEQPAPIKYVVMNADEGDPGAFSDRILLEDDPHACLEGLAIVAHAVGASKGMIYLRREYPDAQHPLQTALTEARQAGLLGPDALGRGLPLDIELVVGEGSYVCGEETALLSSIEGRRPFVRSRPPYPSEQGLFGAPTLIQNVETLANIPWIIAHGGQAYAGLGTSQSRGTKLLSLNSLFAKPGLYEVEFGTSLRTIVEELGGGLRSGTLHGILLGGPLAGVLPPSELDVPLAFEALRRLGASVGHGGLVAFDEHTSILALLHHGLSFGAYESCARCTPCRLGARQLAGMTANTGTARTVPWKMETFEALVSALAQTSLCGHGTGMAELAESVLRYYREELLACFASS